MINTRIGPYRITAFLGEGGFGTVYQACHEELNRQVALKILGPDVRLDPLSQARFVREQRNMMSSVSWTSKRFWRRC